MGRTTILVVMALLIFSMCSIVSFGQTLPVTFHLKEVESRGEVVDAVVDIVSSKVGSEEEQTNRAFILEDAPLVLNLEPGAWDVIFKIDRLDTDGKDYYLKERIQVTNQKDIDLFVYPVASIKGTVVDPLDNVINNAELQFDCSTNVGQVHPKTTDSFGTFRNDYISVGVCKITARYEEGIGSTQVTLAQGNSYDQTIKLDKTIVSAPGTLSFSGAVYLFGLVLLLVLGYFAYTRKKERSVKEDGRKEEKVSEEGDGERKEKVAHAEGKKEQGKVGEKKEEKKGVTLGERAESILPTLREIEKEIIDTIVEQGGKSTQAKVYHATGIPKTSLHRNVESLVAKDILKVRKAGKIKHLQFTDWFLGKEQK